MTQPAQDLLVLYEPEALQWATYLCSVFTGHVPSHAIRLFDVATVTAGHRHDPLPLAQYRCKLLVLTPALVEQASEGCEGGGAPCRVRRFFLSRVLTPAASVVVLLCGVESLDPLLGLVPLQPDQCLVVSTEQEPQEYLDAVVKVVRGGEAAGRRGSRGSAPNGQAGERTNDAPSVVTMPMATVNPQPRPPRGLRVIPLRVPCGGSGEMFVLLRDKAAAAVAAAVGGSGDLKLEFSRSGHSLRVKPKRWSENVLLLRPPPDFPSGKVAVTLYCGACAVDTAHVTYYTPLEDMAQLLTRAADPVAFMCQALQVSSLEQLDQRLSSLVMEGLPSGGLQELALLHNDTPLEGGPHRGALPTLLHLAAQCGLRALCSLLLQVPGARRALATANRHGMTPGALARSHGHTELSTLLREALGEGAADDGVYELISTGVSADPLNEDEEQEEEEQEEEEEEEEEEKEDEEDPYTLVGKYDAEYDNVPSPGVMAAPVAHRAPASTPRPDTTTAAAAPGSASLSMDGTTTFIAQVFKNKTSKGNADLLNFPLDGQGRKISMVSPIYDTFISGVEVGAPGPAAVGGLDGPLGQLPGQVRRGSLSVEQALDMISEWQRLHCRGLDPHQQERLNRLRTNILSSRPAGDRDNVYSSTGRKDSQPAEFYSQPRKGPHANLFGKAEKR